MNQQSFPGSGGRGFYVRDSCMPSAIYVPYDLSGLAHTFSQVALNRELADETLVLSDDETEDFAPVVSDGEAQSSGAIGTTVRVKKRRRSRRRRRRRRQPTCAGGETQGTPQAYEQSYSEPASQETGTEVLSEPATEDACDGEDPHPRRESMASVGSGQAEEWEDVVGEEPHIVGYVNQVTNEEAALIDHKLEEDINRLMETPLVLSALEAGLEVEQVRSALQWSIEEGIDFETGDDLVLHVLGEDGSGNEANDHPSESEENVGDDDCNDWIDVEAEEDRSSPQGIHHRVNHSMVLGTIGDREWRDLRPTDRRPSWDTPVDDQDLYAALQGKPLRWRPLPRPSIRSGWTRPRSEAAALSRGAINNPRSSAVSAVVTSSSRSVSVVSNRDARVCIICLELEVKTVFLPCKHAICCAKCAREVDLCPMCRCAIRDRLDVYFS